jgi:hypothetical protein
VKQDQIMLNGRETKAFDPRYLSFVDRRRIAWTSHCRVKHALPYARIAGELLRYAHRVALELL